MAVRIRMKRLGRRHRPFFRICAMDSRAPRDGKVIEELGYYDPMVPETDARAVLNRDRVDYWLGVGAEPTDKVRVLIKKYGSQGTHLEAQQQALERLRNRPASPPPTPLPSRPEPEAAEEAASAQPASEEAAAERPSAEQAEAEQAEAGQAGEAAEAERAEPTS